jgi:uncharacterized protein (TIGR03790 family)
LFVVEAIVLPLISSLKFSLACLILVSAASVCAQTSTLRAKTLGLIINANDSYSVEVGRYYALKRGIARANIVTVRIPKKAVLSEVEFLDLQSQVSAKLPASVQGLALAWVEPFAAQCNSITSALGWRPQWQLCAQSCAQSDVSPYFAQSKSATYARTRVRPAMLVAASSILKAKQLIDRGIAADGSLVDEDAEPVNAFLMSTADTARNTRAALYPRVMPTSRVKVFKLAEPVSQLSPPTRAILFQTGAMHVPNHERIGWVPGALADHLTSFGGILAGPNSQMSSLEWIESGATASHGTVSEPCSYPQKFPHPAILLKEYLSGSTAVQAYWASVAWPAQSVFIGDPLAVPFGQK